MYFWATLYIVLSGVSVCVCLFLREFSPIKCRGIQNLKRWKYSLVLTLIYLSNFKSSKYSLVSTHIFVRRIFCHQQTKGCNFYIYDICLCKINKIMYKWVQYLLYLKCICVKYNPQGNWFRYWPPNSQKNALKGLVSYPTKGHCNI